ncbi:type IV pilus secretin PilQ [Marinobacterium stanieri]|uniref:type IV pilus secretin PilQ n=1 Tax=Marinobacterium stanieri TaxID=49186 RepID=UPI003A9574EC
MQTVNTNRRNHNKQKSVRQFVPLCLMLGGLSILPGAVSAESILEDVSFTTRPGQSVEVRMQFDSPPPQPKAYMIEQPPRLVLDLPGVSSSLRQKMLSVRSGSIDSLHFAEASDRTRVVANLNNVVGYDTRVDGNLLLLDVGGTATASGNASARASSPATHKAGETADGSSFITDVDFHRLEGDIGRITIDLGSSDVGLDVVEESGKVVINLDGLDLATGSQRLDVQDFSTPVNFIDALAKDNKATILVEPTAEPYDYMVYQVGSKLVVDFKPITAAEQEEQNNLFPYNGERIDLNFQNIEVRTVLQIIAEVAEKNLVVSDNVQGDLTLRLKNVPWDQALDIVLKTQGLDKREAGNVLLVGTAAEIAEREKTELESQKSEQEIAPLVTDFVQIDFRKASDIKERIIEAKLISERGFAMADDETNTLMVRETAKQLQEIRKTIQIFDVEVPQILVQARLVTATSDFAKNIGVRWGMSGSEDNWTVGSNAVVPGTVSQALQVDLGIPDATGSFALGFLSSDFALSAELAALESDGSGELISQPKVITTNGKPAMIKSGQEVGYQVIEDGDVEIEWKDVVLQLEVTPQIIPGGKVAMELVVTEDSIGEILDTGEIAIDTTELSTSVVVNDGETVVLGGVFQESRRDGVSKVPFFGDLPVVGGAFRNKTSEKTKNELLIFITPQMIRESLRR